MTNWTILDKNFDLSLLRWFDFRSSESLREKESDSIMIGSVMCTPPPPPRRLLGVMWRDLQAEGGSGGRWGLGDVMGDGLGVGDGGVSE